VEHERGGASNQDRKVRSNYKTSYFQSNFVFVNGEKGNANAL